MTIEKLLKLESKPQNVLTLGYRFVRDQFFGGVPGAPSLEIVFPNTLASSLISRNWTILLQLVGLPMFQFILAQCVFQELNGGCFVQIAGPNYTELVYFKPTTPNFGFLKPTETKKVAKKCRRRHKRKNAVKNRMDIDLPPLPNAPVSIPATIPSITVVAQKSQMKPSKIIFAKSRMYYARAIRGVNGKVLVGLPKYHSFRPRRTSPRTIIKALADMFPRVFKLESIFSPPVKPKFGFRERALAVRNKGKLPSNVPRRLKPCVKMVEHCLRRTRLINYRALLNYHCPADAAILGLDTKASYNRPLTQPLSAQPWDNDKTKDEETVDLVEFPAEFDELLHAMDEEERDLVDISKIEFTKHQSNYSSVYKLCHSIIERVFAKSWFGSDHNRQHMLQKVKQLIELRRGESFSLHQVMQGLRVNDFKWLALNNIPANPREAKIREALLQDWIIWFFEGFLIPLLRTTFYVTEASNDRNRIHYFRQDVWQAVSEPAFNYFRSRMYDDMTNAETATQLTKRDLGYSYVRILPKEKGARPISNLKRKFTPEEIVGGLKDRHNKESVANFVSKAALPSNSINHLLQPVFQALSHEKLQHPDLVGSTVLNIPDIYARLKPFKKKIESQDGSLPPLYFAKLDVKAAFDSIRQDKLLEIVEQIIKEEEYCMYKYSQAFPSGGRIRTTFVKRARPDMPDFIDLASDLSDKIKNAVFVDNVAYSYDSRDKMVKVLREHLLGNIVNMGSQFCKQIVGIPQGSILSTLLCSFFYGNLERRKLHFVQQDEDGVLLRYVDDFIYISLHQDLVARFVKEMYAGHPEYGCFINKPKSLVNFDLEIGGVKVNTLAEERRNMPEYVYDFSWCGLIVNTQTLEVSGDYTRLQGTFVRDGLNIEGHSHPGLRIRDRLMNFLRPRCHALYIDMDFNSRQRVLRNLYQNFLLAAVKLHLFIEALDQRDTEFVLNCILDSFAFVRLHLKSRIQHETASRLGAKCDLNPLEVEWLGLRAFWEIFRRKSLSYPMILRQLKTRLDDQKFKAFIRHLKPVSDAGQGVFEKVKF
jgi:telomerase reverse transcriptase